MFLQQVSVFKRFIYTDHWQVATFEQRWDSFKSQEHWKEVLEVENNLPI